MVIDPVCQAELDSSQAAAHLRYGEEVYYFCCLTCRNRFLEDPGYWLSEEEEEVDEAELEV